MKISDFAADLATVQSQAREFGSQAGAGTDSILALGRTVYCSAAKGKIAEGDVGAIYRAYAEGVNASEFGGKIDLDNPDSVKSGASKLRSFAKLASVPAARQPFNVVARTIRAINAQAQADGKAKLGASHYEKVLRVVRATVKAGDREIMTEAEILEFLAPADPGATDIAKALKAMIASADRHLADVTIRVDQKGYFQKVRDEAAAQLEAYKAAEGQANLDAEGVEPEGEDLDLAA